MSETISADRPALAAALRFDPVFRYISGDACGPPRCGFRYFTQTLCETCGMNRRAMLRAFVGTPSMLVASQVISWGEVDRYKDTQRAEAGIGHAAEMRDSVGDLTERVADDFNCALGKALRTGGFAVDSRLAPDNLMTGDTVRTPAGYLTLRQFEATLRFRDATDWLTSDKHHARNMDLESSAVFIVSAIRSAWGSANVFLPALLPNPIPGCGAVSHRADCGPCGRVILYYDPRMLATLITCDVLGAAF
jgi:hypothetical protein